VLAVMPAVFLEPSREDQHVDRTGRPVDAELG
jgi:hypothetical protein